MSDPLLQCDSPITFDGFDILAFVSHKFKLLIKGSLIIRDKPVLNRTIKSFLLDLFDKVFTVYKKYNHISIFQKESKTIYEMIRMMQTEWINYFLQNVNFENALIVKVQKLNYFIGIFLKSSILMKKNYRKINDKISSQKILKVNAEYLRTLPF